MKLNIDKLQIKGIDSICDEINDNYLDRTIEKEQKRFKKERGESYRCRKWNRLTEIKVENYFKTQLGKHYTKINIPSIRSGFSDEFRCDLENMIERHMKETQWYSGYHLDSNGVLSYIYRSLNSWFYHNDKAGRDAKFESEYLKELLKNKKNLKISSKGIKRYLNNLTLYLNRLEVISADLMDYEKIIQINWAKREINNFKIIKKQLKEKKYIKQIHSKSKSKTNALTESKDFNKPKKVIEVSTNYIKPTTFNILTGLR